MIKKICRKRKKSYMGDDEMVRKLKSKKVFDQVKIFDEEELEEDWEEFEEDDFEQMSMFDLYRPVKSDFMETMKPGQAGVIEKLSERFELRLSKTEKAILMELKNRGINVSEELRKCILKLDEDIAREINKGKYEEIKKRYMDTEKELQDLAKRYKAVKTLRGETEQEAQTYTNLRWEIKYRRDTLIRQMNFMEKFLEKYREIFVG